MWSGCLRRTPHSLRSCLKTYITFSINENAENTFKTVVQAFWELMIWVLSKYAVKSFDCTVREMKEKPANQFGIKL